MGEKPVEDAKRNHGEYRVEGVLFTLSKQTLAIHGKEAFQDRKVRIPMGNDALRADLHKLKKVTSDTGAPRFVADSDSNGHADWVYLGWLLGINAASGEDVKIEFMGLPSRDEMEANMDDWDGFYSDSVVFEVFLKRYVAWCLEFQKFQ